MKHKQKKKELKKEEGFDKEQKLMRRLQEEREKTSSLYKKIRNIEVQKEVEQEIKQTNKRKIKDMQWHRDVFNKDKQLWIEYEELERQKKHLEDAKKEGLKFKDPNVLEYQQTVRPEFYMKKVERAQDHYVEMMKNNELQVKDHKNVIAHELGFKKEDSYLMKQMHEAEKKMLQTQKMRSGELIEAWKLQRRDQARN